MNQLLIATNNLIRIDQSHASNINEGMFFFLLWHDHCAPVTIEKKVVCFSSIKFVIHSEEGLKLVTSALEALYGGQFTLLTQSIKTKSSFNFPPPK